MRIHAMTAVLGAVLALAGAGCSEDKTSALAGNQIPPPSSEPQDVDPPDGAVNVSPGKAIVVRYQDALRASTVNTTNIAVEDLDLGQPVPITVTMEPDGRGFRIEPVAPLFASEHTFRVTIAGRPGVRFQSGLDVDPFDFEFTTSPDPVITTTTLPDAVGDSSRGDGTDYSQFILRQGGTAPLSFSISDGALPDGLELDPDTGEIFGRAIANPDLVLTSTFTVRVTDADGRFSGQQLQMRTIPLVGQLGFDFAATNQNFQDARSVAPFGADIEIVGGLPPYVVTLLSGDLPNGTALADNPGEQPRIEGNWTVTSSSDETAVFELEVMDAIGTIAQSGQFTVELPPVGSVTVESGTGSSSALKNGRQGEAYSDELTVSGPLGPFVTDATPVSPAYDVPGITYSGSTAGASAPFTFTSSPLGAGAVGQYSFQFRFRDQAGRLIARTFSQRIFNNEAIVFGDSSSAFTAVTIPDVSDTVTVRSLPDVLADGAGGATYNQVITISGGNPPYTTNVTGSFPTGISAAVSGANNQTVTVSGDPTTANQRLEFTVEVTDVSATTVSRTYNIRTIPPGPSITAAPNPMSAGKGGFTYSGTSRTFTATGGFGTLEWDVSSGTTPQGLTFTGTGPTRTVSGTPSAAAAEGGTNGSYSFTMRVRDSLPDRLSNAVTATSRRSATASSSIKIYLSYRFNIYPERLLPNNDLDTSKPNFVGWGCQGCHFSGNPFAGPPIDFDGDGDFADETNANADADGLIDEIVNRCSADRNYVDPGNASGSFLFDKFGDALPNSGCGDGMPAGSAADAAPGRALLQRWIDELDDAGNPSPTNQ